MAELQSSSISMPRSQGRAGDITNAEPHKCEMVAWFAHDRLPEKLVPYARAALERIDDGRTVSAFDWD
jgi:hypothetical protein